MVVTHLFSSFTFLAERLKGEKGEKPSALKELNPIIDIDKTEFTVGNVQQKASYKRKKKKLEET